MTTAMRPFDAFADPEKTVIGWLTEQLGDVKVRNVTSTDLAAPTIRVTLNQGGGGDELTAVCELDVECFGDSRANVWQLTWRMHAAMLRLPGHTARGGNVDDIAVSAFPGYVEYGNPRLHRSVGTYEITSRPQASL